jgi:enoyl-CoA hydratase
MAEEGDVTGDLVRLEIRPAGAREEAGPPKVALVTLQDPAHRNMLSSALVADLLAAMDTIEAQAGIGAIVVTGAPPAFCAGGDLGGLASARLVTDDPGGAERELRAIYEGFLRVARCRLPTVAAVNGPAVGAGMNLALACDVRIAGSSARFESRFLDLGLHPGGGHTQMLSRLAGPEVAAAMVLFGERLDGIEAARRGLAYSCVPDDRLVEEALELAGRAASAPRELALRAKETLRRTAGLDSRDDAVEIELDAQLWSVGEPFFAERIEKARARISTKRQAE